jgi:N-acetylmuramoyl-L-alanine amidase
MYDRLASRAWPRIRSDSRGAQVHGKTKFIATAGLIAGTLIGSGAAVVAAATVTRPHAATSGYAGSSASRLPTPAPGGDLASPPMLLAASDGGPARFLPTASGVLNGKVIVIDPGHNGGNAASPAAINRPIWNGRETEACDTTGTQTVGGYTEALFNWNVARYLAADLRALGATVVLTRTTNTGLGPCVTERATIGNDAHANAALSIHADGGPPDGRGFTILEPVADGVNDAIIGPSDVLGTDLRDAFAAGTGEPVSSYDGTNGIQPRDDLAGTNLSTVPKVFIECANMRNATDAALITTASWQAKAARAIAVGLTSYFKQGT